MAIIGEPSPEKIEQSIKLLNFLLTLDDMELIKISIEGIVEVLGGEISSPDQA